MIGIIESSEIITTPSVPLFICDWNPALNDVNLSNMSFTTNHRGALNAGYYFDGISSCVSTKNNIDIGGDKVSVSLWMKSTKTTISTMFELSSNIDGKEAFVIVLSDTYNQPAGTASCTDHSTTSTNVGFAQSYLASPLVNDDNWHHIVWMIDRSQPFASTFTLYVDNVLRTTSTTSFQTDTSGNFLVAPCYMGLRFATKARQFKGTLASVKIYNRLLTQAEVNTLYTE